MSDQMSTLQALAGIAMWLFIITAIVRRRNKSSRPAGDALRPEIARTEGEGVVIAEACSACGATIPNHQPEAHANVSYRCPVCRLELVRNATTGKLTPAPIEPAGNV